MTMDNHIQILVFRQCARSGVLDVLAHCYADKLPVATRSTHAQKRDARGRVAGLAHAGQMAVSSSCALSLRIGSPDKAMRCADWTRRSRIASAIVGSPRYVCQLSTGSCDVIAVDALPTRSSTIFQGEDRASRAMRNVSGPRLFERHAATKYGATSSNPVEPENRSAIDSMRRMNRKTPRGCAVSPKVWRCLKRYGAAKSLMPCGLQRCVVHTHLSGFVR